MATKQQFKDFLYEIEPSSTTVSRCSTAHNNLRTKVASHETFKEVHVGTFLSGSYKRDTAIRPCKKGDDLHRPDVDIIVQTDHSESDDPSEVIWLIHDVLTECGYSSLEVNRRSVSVTLSDVDMDVVPIIANPNGDDYLIPDKDMNDGAGEWIYTNPPGHTTWTTKVNEDNGGRFKPLVKLFKWWKRERLLDLKKPKGFILECLVAKHMRSEDIGYEELFITLMEKIRDTYSIYVALDMVPNLEDPAVPGNNVFSAVKPEEFKIFHAQVSEDAALAREAFEEDDTDKQLEIWRQIFGPAFPSSNASTAQKSESSSLLRSVVPAAGVARNGLTFPNEPVKLPNKPAGFA
jgi:hypothetical protein